MENASEVNKEIIIKHSKTLREIIKNGEMFVNNYEWISDEDKDEFIESINKLKRILSF